jgi:hypothetical protein
MAKNLAAGKAITNCARQLRLSPQQVMHPKKAGRKLANALRQAPDPGIDLAAWPATLHFTLPTLQNKIAPVGG